LRLRAQTVNLVTKLRLLGDADDTASGTGAGVASLQGLLVSSLAEIVGAGMDNDGSLEQGQSQLLYEKGSQHGDPTYANDALGSDELDELVLDGALGVALAIGLEVA